MSTPEAIQGGVAYVAPGGGANTVTIPGMARLIVRVRDLTGMPLPQVLVRCGAAPARWTDDNGRVELEVTAGRHEVVAVPTVLGFPTPRLDGPPPQFAPGRDVVTVARGETKLVVLMPEATYVPRHRFQWQNAKLRETLFSGRTGQDQGATRNPFYSSRSRTLRLADCVYLATKVIDLVESGNVRTHSLRYRDPSFGSGRREGSGSQRDAALVELEGLDHTALMERLFAVFARDADGSVFPPWWRYLCIHFTGLRYSCPPRQGQLAPEAAAYTYVDPRTHLSRLRRLDVRPEVDRVSDTELDEQWQEVRAYLDDDDDAIIAELARQPTQLDDPDSAYGRARATRDLRALRDPAYAGERKAEILSRFLLLVGGRWIADLDESHSLGALRVRHHLNRPADDAVWKRIVATTRLLNDVVTTDWEDWARPSGLARAVLPRANPDADDWKERLRADLLPVATSAQCNEVTSAAMHARGLSFDRGLAVQASDVGRGRPVVTATSSGAAPVGSEQPEPTSTLGLFRIRDENDLLNIEPGTLMFLLGWKPISFADGLAAPNSENGIRPGLRRLIEDFRFWSDGAGGPTSTGRKYSEPPTVLRSSLTGAAQPETAPFCLVVDDRPRRRSGDPPPRPGTEAPMYYARRGPANYDTLMIVKHVAVVLRGVPDGLITFETDPRTGTTLRSAASVIDRLEVVVARPSGTTQVRPELAGFPLIPRADRLTQQTAAGGMLHPSVYDAR